MSIRVNATLFRLASQARGRTFTRHYLMGTAIEPHPAGGVVMVSTDGHRAIVVHDPDGTCDAPVIVKLPSSALRKCLGRTDFLPRYLSIDIDSKSARLSEEKADPNSDYHARGDILTVHDALIMEAFPNWKAVIPRDANGPAGAGFNPRYHKSFGRLGKMIEKTLHPKSNAMRMWQGNPEGPAIIRWSGVENVFAIMMPMKWYGGETALPAFFDHLKPSEVKAS